jgi:deoxyribonuclease-4
MRRPLGAHVSVAGGLENAFKNGLKSGCEALQIFTKNANRWQAPPLSEEQIKRFCACWKNSGIEHVLAHNAYLINLASPKNGVWNQSKKALQEELLRCHQLGIKDLVMHPGAHLGQGVTFGLERIRKALQEVFLKSSFKVRILLENTAGQGSYLGGDFCHLAALLKGFDEHHMGVCFDTCHAHASGYDLSTEENYYRVMKEFDHVIGINRIKVFHVNDCLKPCGSKVDRHSHIGKGTIGLNGFAALMKDKRFLTIPMLLETPKGDDTEMDRVNLAVLRDLTGEKAP